MHYEHRNAYRHDNGEVEGFLGTGGTKAKAKADAIDQISRKLDQLAASEGHDISFSKSRVIDRPSHLAPEELARVQADWRSGVRY